VARLSLEEDILEALVKIYQLPQFKINNAIVIIIGEAQHDGEALKELSIVKSEL
jgi:hypothetical protein